MEAEGGCRFLKAIGRCVVEVIILTSGVDFRSDALEHPTEVPVMRFCVSHL